ncbi:MAG: NAD(P)-dependent oxidoreductase [Syntrophorhabdaceae bacterium]|nr:NAD(P)-dependent oxidoreductase [Syntrophorhabdaceae bacterium]
MTTKSKILITGGAGSCGKYLAGRFLDLGHEVRVIDKDTEPLRAIKNDRLEVFQAGLEDRDAVKKAVEGTDAIFHLAWSFSEVPLETFEQDLIGHLYLLEEAASQKVRHLIYASTAVVYGKPKVSPVDEEHPLLVDEARKPLYGIAKAAAEKLCVMYSKEGKVPSTVIRFWWAYGDEIGGKHLRAMLKTAASGEALEVPAGAGGSFLHMEDLSQGIEKCLFNPVAYGQTFNFATAYVLWKDVAEMVRDVTGSSSTVRVIPGKEWKGAAFLNDPWELSDAKARNLVVFRPKETSEAMKSLKKAIAACWAQMNK